VTTMLEDLHRHPETFAPWFKLALERLSRLGKESR
jgi:hypothetical protein